MKALVISDSHGAVGNFLDVLEKHKDIKTIFFLGDGADDVEELVYLLKDRNVIAVRGNCDFSSNAPYSIVKDFNSKRIYLTHGHMEHVKYGLGELKIMARNEKADLALYGHTHEQMSDYDDGLYIFNPGSLRDGRYGIIDVVVGGIVMNEMKLW